MQTINWLWTSYFSLNWWQMLLWGIYFLYFVGRSWHIWNETDDEGILKGYKNVIVGRDEYFRLYHLVRTIIDIPPLVFGLFFPVLRKMLSFKIFKFDIKDKK